MKRRAEHPEQVVVDALHVDADVVGRPVAGVGKQRGLARGRAPVVVDLGRRTRRTDAAELRRRQRQVAPRCSGCSHAPRLVLVTGAVRQLVGTRSPGPVARYTTMSEMSLFDMPVAADFDRLEHVVVGQHVVGAAGRGAGAGHAHVVHGELAVEGVAHLHGAEHQGQHDRREDRGLDEDGTPFPQAAGVRPGVHGRDGAGGSAARATGHGSVRRGVAAPSCTLCLPSTCISESCSGTLSGCLSDGCVGRRPRPLEARTRQRAGQETDQALTGQLRGPRWQFSRCGGGPGA